jgi:hypothetical protein
MRPARYILNGDGRAPRSAKTESKQADPGVV